MSGELSRRRLLSIAAATVPGALVAEAAWNRTPAAASAAGPIRAAYQGPPRYPPTGMPRYGAWTHSLIGAGGFVTGIFTTPADPDVIYLTNDASGTYRSDDRGTFWYMVDDGTPARGASIDPRDANRVVLVKEDGIHHSARVTANYENPALTLDDVWLRPVRREGFAQTNGTFRGRGNVVARDPADPDLLVAGTLARDPSELCVYRSTDGGATWTLLANGPADIQAVDVRFDPHRPGTVYVASQADDRTSDRTFTPGLWRSADAGDTWAKLVDDAPAEFRFDPDHPDVIYGYFHPDLDMGVGTSVERSTDGGQTWTEFMAGLPAVSFEAIEARPGEVFVFSNEPDYGAGIWRLPAGGSTWEVYNAGSPDTVDDDAWWESETDGPPGARRPTIDNVSGVAFNSGDPDEWYLTSAYATYKSADAGLHWTYSSTGLEEMVTMEVVQDPTPGSGIVHAAVADWMYFRLIDGGERYEIHRYPDIHILNTIAVSPANPDRIYAASANYASSPPVGRIVVSGDKGASWTSVDAAAGGLPVVELNDTLSWYETFNSPDGEPHPVSPAIMGLAAHPRIPDVAVAAIGGTYEEYTGTSWGGFPDDNDRTGTVGFFRSTDGGTTWDPLAGNFTGSVPAQTFSYNNPLAMSGDGTVVAAPWYAGPLQCWDPDTEEWFVPDVDFGGDPYAVTADPHTDGRFLLAVRSGTGGAWETRDSGRTWRRLVTARVDGVAYDVHDAARIAVGLADERFVYFSDDSGETFERLERIPDQNFAYNLAFAGSRLVVGPGGGSYFFTDLPILLRVDVQPTIDARRQGLIRVTIRPRPGFDPTEQVDVASLRFGAMDYVTAERGARPFGAHGDGGRLVVRFPFEGTRFEPGDDRARLVGATVDGVPLLGTDAVRVG